MHKITMLALLLVVWNFAGAQSPQENQELKNAVLRLRQAAVLRTLEDCKAKGGSVKTCNSLLELTHQRELKIIERLQPAPTDPAVNMDEMNREMAACYSPNYGYVETVECWSQLSDRLDATHKGRSLVTSAGGWIVENCDEAKSVDATIACIKRQSQSAEKQHAEQTKQAAATGATARLWVLVFLSTGPVPGVADHAGIRVFSGVFAAEGSCLDAAKLWRDAGMTNVDCVQSEVKP